MSGNVARPMVSAAVATALASAAEQYGKFPGLIEAQTGLRAFALVALSRSAWEVVRQLPVFRPDARRLQIELEAANQELTMVKSEVEAMILEKAHMEAQLVRSEQLRQQLHASFASVLARLEKSERDESQLRQEILRIMTLAAGGASETGMEVSREPSFAFAPSTPSSRASRKRKTDQRGSSTRCASSALSESEDGDVSSDGDAEHDEVNSCTSPHSEEPQAPEPEPPELEPQEREQRSPEAPVRAQA
ncbi:unnamed protein product, partial [Effrenium voratum]